MSLSKARILHGPRGDASAFATRSRHAGAWDEATQGRYLEDVRARAQEAAKTILAQAMAEAQTIREQALQQGLAEGRAQAEAELEAERQRLAELVSGLQQAWHEETTQHLCAADDALRQLLRLAVEKAVGVRLTQEREAILWETFQEARKQLLSSGPITVWVHPDDVARMESLLEASTPETTLRVAPDPNIRLGGVRLTTSDAQITNTVEERLQQVLSILDGRDQHG
jgi:flagellar assembly protein FliH